MQTDQRLTRVLKASEAMLQAPDLERLMDITLALIGEVFRYDHCSILLHDQESGLLSPVRTRGYARSDVGGLTIRPGQGVCGRVFESGEPLLIEDVSSFPDYIRALPGARCEMAVPLTLGDRVIGVLDAEGGRAGLFGRDDLELFQIFANQLAAAVVMARQNREVHNLQLRLDERATQLDLFRTLVRGISDGTDLARILSDILLSALRLTGADVAVVDLYADAGPQVVSRAVGRRGEARARVFGSGLVGVGPDLSRAPLDGLLEGLVRESLPLQVEEREVGRFHLGLPPGLPVDDWTRGLFETLSINTAVAIGSARAAHESQFTYYQALLSLVSALESKDAYTRGHSERVTGLARSIASRLGLDDASIQVLGYVGLLHDVGKIGVSDAILNKRTPLDPDEWEAVREHPRKGVQIVEPLLFLREAAPIILHHHERYDGRGYPRRLAGEEIPLAARIIAVADSYDAMTTDRPYRSAMSHEKAIGELVAGSGSQFDPRVIDAALDVLRHAPST